VRYILQRLAGLRKIADLFFETHHPRSPLTLIEILDSSRWVGQSVAAFLRMVEEFFHCRKSNGQSPEMQLRELREYCDRRGWTVSGEYVDAGISGAKDRRPELDRLMSHAHRRPLMW